VEIPALDRSSSTSLALQLVSWFREAALEGYLAGGEGLPSTRALAAELGVSRNVVCEAYELLAAEGYIECSGGRRARVAPGLALGGAFPRPGLPESPAAPAAPGSRIPPSCDFRTGLPDLRSIPRRAWARALLLAAEGSPDRDWLYGRPEGLPELRAEIAAYLFRARGMRVPPQRVFVTAGATQALHILALVAARSDGRPAAVEDPCHLGMARTLRGVGLEVAPVEADEAGMLVERLRDADASLAAERRVAHLGWAREARAFVVEDDYDAEFRYSGPPVAPLWSLDPERVAYIGSFSKTLFPAIRIGFALVPPSLEGAWRDARTHADVQNPAIPQAALARLLADRSVDRHVARMRRLYARKRAILLAAIGASFGAAARVLGDASGLHVAVRVAALEADECLAERGEAKGLRLVPAERYAIVKGRFRDTLILGYGAAEPSRIAPGIEALAAFLSEEAGLRKRRSR
jgi:GntR family transcriptional regulator/MocR family aminotransferase